MTYEKFNEARDLHNQMEYLSELECLIQNAGGSKNNLRNTLAVIQDEHYETNPYKTVITKCEVLNHIALSDEMKDKFLQVIREEHNRVYEEFSKL